MRRNRVIYNIKFIPNIEGWENYHISRRGRLYRYYPNRRVWMILNGTISRGRVYHILRNGTSRRGGWEMYLSEFQLKKEEELINLRYDLIQTFEIFVRGCKDIEKLKRLTKRYSKYNENNQSI